MRTQDEVQQALKIAESHIEAINSVSCPSEQQAAYAQMPHFQARLEAFKWVLDGEPARLLVERYFVPAWLVKEFRRFVNQFDDFERESLAKAADEHYDEWRDGAEPGATYPGYTENDPEPWFEPQVQLLVEAAGSTGSFFDLDFLHAWSVFRFAYEWNMKIGRLAAEASKALSTREQQAIDKVEAVLAGDGSDPDSGSGAWGDCGEVEVPILLAIIRRLTKSVSLEGGQLNG